MKDLMYVEKLSVSFDGFVALNLEYFSVAEGELRVVIGPNGAGKSTFMDLICGKTKATTGRIVMDGKDLTQLSEKQIFDHGVGRKFQNPNVFGSLSVYDNLALAHKARKGVFPSMFNHYGKNADASVAEILERIGLTEEKDRIAQYLSHGQKQWLEIGMVLAQKPRLLLIDEPAAGMSDEETERTGELLLSLKGDHTIIVIEHDMEFVRQIANTVSVLVEGKLLTEGPMEEVQNDRRVIACYLGADFAESA